MEEVATTTLPHLHQPYEETYLSGEEDNGYQDNQEEGVFYQDEDQIWDKLEELDQWPEEHQQAYIEDYVEEDYQEEYYEDGQQLNAEEAVPEAETDVTTKEADESFDQYNEENSATYLEYVESLPSPHISPTLSHESPSTKNSGIHRASSTENPISPSSPDFLSRKWRRRSKTENTKQPATSSPISPTVSFPMSHTPPLLRSTSSSRVTFSKPITVFANQSQGTGVEPSSTSQHSSTLPEIAASMKKARFSRTFTVSSVLKWLRTEIECTDEEAIGIIEKIMEIGDLYIVNNSVNPNSLTGSISPTGNQLVKIYPNLILSFEKAHTISTPHASQPRSVSSTSIASIKNMFSTIKESKSNSAAVSRKEEIDSAILASSTIPSPSKHNKQDMKKKLEQIFKTGKPPTKPLPSLPSPKEERKNNNNNNNHKDNHNEEKKKDPEPSSPPVNKKRSSENSKIKAEEEKKAGAKPANCDRCDQPASLQCNDCFISICESCSAILHGGKWANHKIVKILPENQVTSAPSSPQAPHHQTDELKNLRKHDIRLDSLSEICKLMYDPEEGIKLRTRTYYLKSYKNVFFGIECVDWMLSHLAIRNRMEAVQLGIKLLESGYISSISRDNFKDEKLLYRFTSPPDALKESEDDGRIQTKVVMTDFDLLRVLGSGGFGKVVQVRKKSNARTYAMKIIKKSKVRESAKRINDIAQERAILQNNFPFLLHLQFAFQTEDLLCFVMDFIGGGDLWFHLKRTKTGFPLKIARFFASEMVLALEYLHKCGVVYRDLKPENILIDNEGHIVLADFGISKMVGEDDRTNSIVGTTCFMAPEVIKGEKYGKGVDWWSFGVLLYHMMTGKHPFYSKDRQDTIDKVLNKRIRPVDGLNKKAFQLIERLLDRSPDTRLSDADKIKKHPFFKRTDWDKLLLKKVKPPFKVSVKGPHDLSNFEDEQKNRPIITEQPPSDDDESSDEEDSNVDYFPNFSFANPNL